MEEALLQIHRNYYETEQNSTQQKTNNQKISTENNKVM